MDEMQQIKFMENALDDSIAAVNALQTKLEQYPAVRPRLNEPTAYLPASSGAPIL